MTVAEAKTLLGVRDRTGVKICEAFMIRSAPQWLRVRQLLDEGRIGELRAVNAHFSYFNVDPANIRNQWRRAAAPRTTSAATAFKLRALPSAKSRGAWSRLSIAIRRWVPTG
jgi:predicted dehydrogenase